MLADGLVRLERSPDGVFEDRASTLAIRRDLPVPRYQVVESPNAVEVITDRFHLIYDRGPFTPAGLSLQVRGNISAYHRVWRYAEPVDDLGGTVRTLDMADGRTVLGPGVVSRWGFAVLDDSTSLVFEAALGRSTDDDAPISFDIADRTFLDAYFIVLHRSLEDDGVDTRRDARTAHVDGDAPRYRGGRGAGIGHRRDR